MMSKGRKGMKKVVAAIVFALCLISSGGMTSVNADTSGSVPVTYTNDENAAYRLSVKAEGPGTLINGNNSIREEQYNYVLSTDEDLSFIIKPDKNATVDSIILNGVNVSSSVKNDVITVEGQDRDQSLVVRFKSVSKDTPTHSGKGPQTGDVSKSGILLLILLVSAGAGTYMYSRIKKSSDDLYVDIGGDKDGEK